jgi:asparagine synthase (glutamine-hydrolysing)
VGSFRVVGVPCELLVYSNDGADLVAFGHPRFAKDDCGARDAFGFRLIEAVRAEGAAAFGALSGDFALALSDSKTGRDWLAVDRFSTRRLAYCADGLKIAFASDIDALLTLLGRRGEIDPQGIYNYVYFHVVPGPASVYRDVRFVPAGHCLLIAAEGRLTEVKYWAPGFVEDAAGSFPELKQELVDALQRATSRAAAGARCGSFLSGGIDSSTLSGMLARNRDSGVDTFSIGFNAAGYDEMMYARIATRHFGTRHHEYYVTPQDVVAAIPHIVEQYDQPFGNASAVPAFYCARLAAGHGVDRLLAGDGGDELFGGNARYARQKLFAYYEALPRSVRESFIEPALIGHVLTAKVPIVRRLRRYVEQAAVPMPDRYHLGSELVEIGPAKIFTPDFLAHVDPTEPSTLYRETFAPFAGCSLVNQMLAIDFRFTLADSDLPKVTRMCEMAGVDVVFPMLDANVVDFAAKLPPHYKLRGTKLRWFFKEALRDFLPPEIIGKKKHGFGLPAGLWLQSHEPLRVMARDALEHLGRHGIVNRSFANDAFDRLLPLHPPYYGGFIWVLMMLGLWLHSRHR